MVFLEIPGIQLSLAEAARLTELEAHICQILLSALENLGFLRRAEDGGYQRQLSE
jgi:DNA-binding IclR family transcriptional regulator